MKRVVLTHGWGFGEAVWRPLADALRVRGWRVGLAGLPGFDGRPARPAEAWCSALARQVPEGALWVAWSLGGRLALQAVAAGQARPAGLCLIGVGDRFVAGDGAGLPERAFEDFRAGLAEPGRLLRRFAALVAQGDPAARQVLRFLRGLSPAASAETLAHGLELLRSPLPERLPELCCALVRGSADALVPAAAAAALAGRLPGAGLYQPEAGHAPQLSAPGVVLDCLEAMA